MSLSEYFNWSFLVEFVLIWALFLKMTASFRAVVFFPLYFSLSLLLWSLFLRFLEVLHCPFLIKSEAKRKKNQLGVLCIEPY